MKDKPELHFIESRGFITRIRKRIVGRETTEFENLDNFRITRTLKIVIDSKKQQLAVCS